MKFTVIGGDMRIARLCHLLASDGHKVRAFALEKAVRAKDIYCADNPQQATTGAECVVLPLPITWQRGILNAPLSSGEFEITDILDSIEPGSLVCGGFVDKNTEALAAERGLRLFDYYKREELVIFNAVATAEGAIEIIMRETAETIWGSRILIIGYGRIGKVLSEKLRALGADVTVSARNKADMAWIEANRCKSLDTRNLDGHISSFDVVVNTVPALVLNEARLRELGEDTLCLDLASKPGGMDFAVASRLGVRAIWALGLPGEVAPVSAGAIIRDTIYNILEEQEETWKKS